MKHYNLNAFTKVEEAVAVFVETALPDDIKRNDRDDEYILHNAIVCLGVAQPTSGIDEPVLGTDYHTTTCIAGEKNAIINLLVNNMMHTRPFAWMVIESVRVYHDERLKEVKRDVKANVYTDMEQAVIDHYLESTKALHEQMIDKRANHYDVNDCSLNISALTTRNGKKVNHIVCAGKIRAVIKAVANGVVNDEDLRKTMVACGIVSKHIQEGMDVNQAIEDVLGKTDL